MSQASKTFLELQEEQKKFMVAERLEQMRIQMGIEARNKELSRMQTLADYDKKGISDKQKQDGTMARSGELLDEALKKAVDSQMNGMTQWGTAMMEFLHICELIVDTGGPLAAKKRYQLGTNLKDGAAYVGTGLKSLTYDRIRSKINPDWDKPEVELPKLFQNVEMSADNKLVVHPLYGSESGGTLEASHPMAGSAERMNDLFKKGVDIWLLEKHGFKKDPNHPGEYKKVDPNGRPTGVALDKATFDGFKNDPATGFAAFLKESAPGQEYGQHLSNS